MKYVLAIIISYSQILELVDSGNLSTAYKHTLEQKESNRKYHFLGYIREQQGRYQGAVIDYYNGISLGADNDTVFYQLHKNLGKSLWKCGAYEQALIETRKAQNLLEEFGNGEFKKKQLPSLYYNLGKIHKELGDFQEATFNFMLASDLYSSEQSKARIWNMLGLMSFSEPEKAVVFFDSIINSNVKGSNLAKALHNKANLHTHLDLDPIPLWNEAFKIGNDKDKFLALMDMGHYTKDVEVLLKAIDYIPDSQVALNPLYYNVFRFIGDVYYEKENFVESNYYFNKYFESNDRFLNWMSESKLLADKHATMNAIIQYKQKESIRSNRDNITLGWQFTGVFFLFLVVYLGYRYQTKRKSFKDLIEGEN